MVIEIISGILAIFILYAIIVGIIDYCKFNKREKISFKESMDLTDLPIITLYNNNRRFNFMLDTGATMSLIDENVLSNLDYEESEESGTIFGLEGNKVAVNYVKAKLNYKDRDYEEEFQVMDMSAPFNHIKSENGVTLSGILGNSFFTKYKYVLDFKELIAYSKK